MEGAELHMRSSTPPAAQSIQSAAQSKRTISSSLQSGSLIIRPFVRPRHRLPRRLIYLVIN